MAPITPCVSTCVGCIEEHDRRTHSKRTELIYYETELFIGRDANTCQFVIDDPLVSNKHLRIYTIIFDQGNPGEVAPLVYAQDLSTNGTWWNAYGMKRDHGGYLLSDGDILGVGSYITLTFKSNTNQLDVPFPRHQEDEMDRFRSEFEVTRRLLGSGAYGKVYMAFDKRSRKQVACKIVDTINLSRQGRQLDKRQTAIGEKNKEYANHEVELAHETGRQLKRSVKLKTQKTYVDWKLATYEREVEILQDLRHPNIIGLEKVFKSAKYIYMFQELVTGGDLFSYLEFKDGKLFDVEAAVIIRQIVIALDYLHEQNIAHRDIKPDNVLMTSLESGSRVVLTDFGCARRVESCSARMQSLLGTMEYTAPEIAYPVRRAYTKAVDLWSLGCLTVVLLTGGSPFADPIDGNYSSELARNCDLEVLEQDENWKTVGSRPKDFVRKLLVLDESRRMSARQALQHEWFTNPAHKKEFERLYERSIKGWKKRIRSGLVTSTQNANGHFSTTTATDTIHRRWKPPIPMLPPMTKSTLPREDKRTTGEPRFERTRHIPEAKIIRPFQTTQRCPSLTLSDPHYQRSEAGSQTACRPSLPDADILHDVLVRMPSAVERSTTEYQPPPRVAHPESLHAHPTDYDTNPPKSPSRIRIPFSPAAWNDGMETLRSIDPDHKIIEKKKKRNLFKHLLGSITEEKSDEENRFVQEVADLVSIDDRPKHPGEISKKKGKESHLRDVRLANRRKEEEEDQVYEEFADPISGKRQRVLYGQGKDINLTEISDVTDVEKTLLLSIYGHQRESRD